MLCFFVLIVPNTGKNRSRAIFKEPDEDILYSIILEYSIYGIYMYFCY